MGAYIRGLPFGLQCAQSGSEHSFSLTFLAPAPLLICLFFSCSHQVPHKEFILIFFRTSLNRLYSQTVTTVVEHKLRLDRSSDVLFNKLMGFVQFQYICSNLLHQFFLLSPVPLLHRPRFLSLFPFFKFILWIKMMMMIDSVTLLPEYTVWNWDVEWIRLNLSFSA